MLRHVTSSRALARLCTAALLATGVGAVSAAPSQAATAPTVTTNVLVVDDGAPMVGALRDRLDTEGVKTTVVKVSGPTHPPITASFLANGSTGNFSGIVLPSEAPASLSTGELSAIAGYEAAFGVREIDAYTWAHPEVGLSYAADPGYSGPVDGMTASVTPAAKSGDFGYLQGSFTFDDVAPSVDESWGYLATPYASLPAGSSFTPLVTAPIPNSSAAGSVLGVYAHDGREQLVSTVAYNTNQQSFRTLTHGMISWLTRGASTSMYRNYFSVHADDVFLPDARWSIEGKCTIGDGCDPVKYPEDAPGSTIRMTPADVTYLSAWQKANDLKIDLAFNGAGSDEISRDALTTALKSTSSQYRWINHTYEHPYLGCVQNFATVPWSCATSPNGAIQWASITTISDQIGRNRTFALLNGLSTDYGELVTGEHSGLKSLPQMPNDNPNLAAALTLRNVKWVASDASREQTIRRIGTATTVPRYPMNIYYNVGTKKEETSEYNYLYTTRANGGGGACEDNPTVSTCIDPLDLQTGFDSYIAPTEVRIAFSHILGNDPRPHYVHQSNLTEDRIIYPVLDAILKRYRSTFATNAPVINPTMSSTGDTLTKQAAWDAAKSKIATSVTGNRMTIKNTGSSDVFVPVTVPTGTRKVISTLFNLTVPYDSASYAGQLSDWVRIGAGSTLVLQLPNTPFTAGVTAAKAGQLATSQLTTTSAIKAKATTATVQDAVTTTVLDPAPDALTPTMGAAAPNPGSGQG